MGIPLKFSKKEKYFLALDIGTETIKGLVFERINEKILILKSSLKYFEPFGIFNSRFFEEDLMKKIISAIIEEINLDVIPKSHSRFGVGMQAHFQDKPKFIFLGLPANILKSQISIERIKRKNPQEKIQEREAESITKNVLALAKEETSQKFAKKTGISVRDINFLNLKILEIKIDGYGISQLLGFSGKNLDFRLISTFLLRYDLERIKKIIHGLNLEIVKIADPVGNLTSALSDKTLSGIFLDVGGKISRIIVIQDRKIKEISEFEGGGENFSKALNSTLGISKTEAENLKSRYSKKNLSEEVRKRIKEIFSPTANSWFNNLKLTLKEVQKNGTLFPSTIFLFGGGSLLPEIQEILVDGDWEELPFLKKPEVKFLLPKDLKNFEDKTQMLTNTQSTPPLLICYEK